MHSLYYLSVTIHVLAALVWLGGMFFLALVGAPVLRGVENPELRQRLFDQLGYRFRSVGWASLGVLLITGVLNLWYRGALSAAMWRDPGFANSGWATALKIKLVAVTVMLIVEAYHDWVLGPRAGKVQAGSTEALALRRQASMYARISALAGIVIVLAAIRLARP
ncbi:MAG: DUF4149 domain-containing protein [Gemmatimonadaceae bacterium]|nr:DUF4149 domain-containing protein [Gemmatimonadaceae bacterium]